MALNKYEEKMINVVTETLGGVQAAFSYQKQDADPDATLTPTSDHHPTSG